MKYRVFVFFNDILHDILHSLLLIVSLLIVSLISFWYNMSKKLQLKNIVYIQRILLLLVFCLIYYITLPYIFAFKENANVLVLFRFFIIFQRSQWKNQQAQPPPSDCIPQRSLKRKREKKKVSHVKQNFNPIWIFVFFPLQTLTLSSSWLVSGLKPPLTILLGSMTPLSILLNTDRAAFRKTSSTFSPVNAEVSKNKASFSWAKRDASKNVTCLSSFKSLLLPVNTTDMSFRPICLESTNQDDKWSNVLLSLML